jgi:hypothetical protein
MVASVTWTPWLYETEPVKVTTLQLPARYEMTKWCSVITYPDPTEPSPDEPDPEDDWTEE